MQESSTRDLAVGAFVLLGLLAIAYLSLQVGGVSLGGEGGQVLIARFDDIGGLTPRSPVRVAGVKVGRVQQIELDDDLRARVVLDVDANLGLSVDTAAAIRTAGLLGDQFIALEPGAEDVYLESGEEFVFTESAWNVDALVGALVHGDATSEED